MAESVAHSLEVVEVYEEDGHAQILPTCLGDGLWVGFILDERDLLETGMTVAIPASRGRSHPAALWRSASQINPGDAQKR